MRPPVSPALFDQFARGWRGYVLIGLIAFVSSLFGAGALPVMDRDEARFAQATRQMLETGDYVRIRIQDEERNKKPIGIHWLQAASVAAFEPITGRLNAIWPYRVPSALGAVLAALATCWAGMALVGQRAAFLGAALFAACVLLGFEGMTAKTDAALAGFTTLAMAALARLRSAEFQNQKGLTLVFWVALACAVLIKGPVAPLVAGLTLAALAFWERRWDWMKPLLWWPGPLIAALIVAPWMIAIGMATDGRFFIDAITGDLAPKIAGGQEGHFALPGYHLLLLPFLIFPATYALPFAAKLGWQAARAARDDATYAGHRFLIAWAAPTILMFEALPTKLAHYTLPAFPAIALLCGAGLLVALRRRWRTEQLVGLVLFALAGGAIVALMATGATFMPGDEAAGQRRAISTGLVGAALVGAAIAGFISLKRPSLRVAIAVTCALALSYSLRQHILPDARRLLVSSEAAAALTRARLTPREDLPLWVVGYRETSFVFITRTDIRLASAEDAGARAAPGDAMMIEARALPAVTAELARRHLAFRSAVAPVLGHNIGNGDEVALLVGTVEEVGPVEL